MHFQTSGFYHFLHAVPANDVDRLCGPDALPTLGAYILSCAGFLWLILCPGLCASGSRLASRAWWWCPAPAPVHGDLCPPLCDDVVNQPLAWLRDGPAVFLVVADDQSPPLRLVPKLLVVIAPASGTVLHVVGNVVEMDHLMDHCGRDRLYGPLQRLSAQVEFMPPVVLALPCPPYGNVSVGPWCALDGDDRLFDFPVKKVPVERPEHLFQVSCCPAGLCGLFHASCSFLTVHFCHAPQEKRSFSQSFC